MLCRKSRQLYTIIVVIFVTFIIVLIFTENFGYSSYNELPTLNYTRTSPNEEIVNISIRYVLNNPDTCRDSEAITAVFIITSYFANLETRNAIRKTLDDAKFLSSHVTLRHVFLLGQSSNDKFVSQGAVNEESRQYRDIVQGNFTEAYRNLTYKHLMGLSWAVRYCPNALYIVKMDDDTVVNAGQLETILYFVKPISDKSFIAGYKLSDMKPIRDPENKWYVTKQEYSFTKYPTFVSGWFYITTPAVARKVAILAKYEKYFWIDDLFVTGILASKLKIRLYDISHYFTANSEFMQCCLQDFDKGLQCDIFVGPNGGDVNMIYEFNKKARKCATNNCKKRDKPINETCVAEKKVNLGRGSPIVNNFKL